MCSMPIDADRAIVLRLSDYSESSQIATLFTRGAGLVRLIAKGVRRGTKERFAVGLDLLEEGELRYVAAKPHVGLGTLTEWKQRDLFAGLRRELWRMQAGAYAAELTIGLTAEYDAHPALFDALRGLLAALSVSPNPPREWWAQQHPHDATAPPDDPRRALSRFQLAALGETGFAPDLRACQSCGRPRVRNAPAYFSSAAGGLVCRDCEMHFVEKRRVSSAMLDQPETATRAVDWFDLWHYHAVNVSQRPYPTAAALRELLARSGAARP
jgi:DNA repair protein RecO (recombination protein O)